MVKASHRGVSLLELMVVVAIVGIISAIALPSVSSGVRRAREPAEVIRLRTFLTETRSLARRANRCVQLVINGDNTLTRTVVASCTGDLAKQCDCSAPLIPIQTTATLKLASSIKVSGVSGNDVAIVGIPTAVASGTNILFLSNGATPYIDPVDIQVSLVESQRQQSLQVLPASGIIRHKVGP